MKINWKQKLTSRKFWCAVIGFVTALLTAFNTSELTIEQVTAIISATSILIAYIIGEGMVDSARIKNEDEQEVVLAIDGEELSKALSGGLKAGWIDNRIPNVNVGVEGSDKDGE